MVDLSVCWLVDLSEPLLDYLSVRQWGFVSVDLLDDSSVHWLVHLLEFPSVYWSEH